MYRSRSASNGTFEVTVTNVQTAENVKSHYLPRAGYHFVIVYLSQQNMSDRAQVYTGRFTLQDGSGASYEEQEGLCNFYLVVLRPGGTNFGYLVYEIPQNAAPRRLMLNLSGRTPLGVDI